MTSSTQDPGWKASSLHVFKKKHKSFGMRAEACHQNDIHHAETFLHCKTIAKLILATLVYRRSRGNANLTYKLMKASTLSELFPFVGPNSRTRGHKLKLVRYPNQSPHSTLFPKSCQQLE